MTVEKDYTKCTIKAHLIYFLKLVNKLGLANLAT